MGDDEINAVSARLSIRDVLATGFDSKAMCACGYGTESALVRGSGFILTVMAASELALVEGRG